MENKEYYKIRTSVHVILTNPENMILLKKRSNTGYHDNEWELPSGHLEKNETLINAAKRECFEEINFKPIYLKFVHIAHRKSDSKNHDFIDEDYIEIFYTSSVSYLQNEEIFNKEPNKCSEIKWFDMNNLPLNMIYYTKNGIYNMKNYITYSELGW